jgi:type VI protein secretion system component Hcp
MLSTSHFASRCRPAGRSRALVLLAVAAGLGLPASAHAERAFIKMPGKDLVGESVNSPFPGRSELTSYSWDLSRSPGGSGDQAVAKFGGFRLKKRVDRASPGLMRAAATGESINSALVTVVRDDGNTYLEYCLRGVTAVSDRVEHTPAGGPPIETVELRFAGLEQRYQQFDPSGRIIMGTHTSGWSELTQSPLVAFAAPCGS